MLRKFGKNFYPEFSGYCFEENGGIYISVIQSKEKRRGNFSRFLEDCKRNYKFIKVPCPFPLMKKICLKKGFKEITEYSLEANEDIGVLIYRCD